MTRTRSFWGWGWDDEAVPADGVAKLATSLSERFGRPLSPAPTPRLEDIVLPEPAVTPPRPLARVCSTDRRDRASHTYGKSFRDVVRGFAGDFSGAPDVVAFPASDADVVAVLDWCTTSGVACVPYGGGSSVVGGVEAGAARQGRPGVVTLDLTRLDRVLEVDRTSRAARIQAGALGPVLEGQLRPHDLTLRHFPQSFEQSTLGGWLATRAGGHFATVYTHIDDLVESMRVVTPSGVSESRRLPGSGAGPSPDRVFLGSEGTLGVITEAWMRVQDRPRWKASAAVRFASLAAGAEAVRALSQAALFPTNCRLLDPAEAMTAAGATDGAALLVLGFESADHPLDAWMARAVEICADHGGRVPEGVRVSGPDAAGVGREGAAGVGREGAAGVGRAGAEGAWRGSFLRAPYTRDALVALGVIVETFETACTWEAFPALHAGVTEAVEASLAEVCGGGWLTCRFTHVYPDGPAPYFSVVAPGRRGSQIAQWAEIKAAASEALLAHGGTITHHHAVGRDHRPWYDRQRPEPFAAALAAAKRVLDPAWVLNPGVLLDPPP